MPVEMRLRPGDLDPGVLVHSREPATTERRGKSRVGVAHRDVHAHLGLTGCIAHSTEMRCAAARTRTPAERRQRIDRRSLISSRQQPTTVVPSGKSCGRIPSGRGVATSLGSAVALSSRHELIRPAALRIPRHLGSVSLLMINTLPFTLVLVASGSRGAHMGTKYSTRRARPAGRGCDDDRAPLPDQRIAGVPDARGSNRLVRRVAPEPAPTDLAAPVRGSLTVGHRQPPRTVETRPRPRRHRRRRSRARLAPRRAARRRTRSDRTARTVPRGVDDPRADATSRITVTGRGHRPGRSA